MRRQDKILVPSISEHSSHSKTFRFWGRVAVFLAVFCLFAKTAAFSASSGDSSHRVTAVDDSSDSSWESSLAALNIHLPKEFHPWGMCEVGAWNFSKTIIENRRKNSSSNQTVMETCATLREKNDFSCSTVTESVILLAGKTIPNEPKTSCTNFWGLSPDEKISVKELSAETLEIDGIPLKCRVVKFRSCSGSGKQETTFWINETTAPYLLRKERTFFDSSGEKILQTLRQNVTSLNFQLSICGKVLNVFQYSQETVYPAYVSNSEVVASLSVPGHVVTQITHEKDLAGKPLQDISTELLDYGTSRQDYQSGIYRSSVRAKRLVVIPPASSIHEREDAFSAIARRNPEKDGMELDSKSDTENALSETAALSEKHTVSVKDTESALTASQTSRELSVKEKTLPDESISGNEKQKNENIQAASEPRKESLIRQNGFEVSEIQSETDLLTNGLELTGKDYQSPISENSASEIEKELTETAFLSMRTENEKNPTISLKISVDPGRQEVSASGIRPFSQNFFHGRFLNGFRQPPQQIWSEDSIFFSLQKEDIQREMRNRQEETKFLKELLLSEMDLKNALNEIEKYSRQSLSMEESGKAARRIQFPGDDLCFRQVCAYWQSEKVFQARSKNSNLNISLPNFFLSLDWSRNPEGALDTENTTRIRSFSPLYDSNLRLHSKARERRNGAVSIKNSRIVPTKSIREEMMAEENEKGGDENEAKKQGTSSVKDGFFRKSIQFLIQRSEEIP
ncbi:MAG: hypothetical protein IJF17_07925 [Thermoguttaceae bacterium]|nr:hypothetical protein [Thermoguttaceae bacterium]